MSTTLYPMIKDKNKYVNKKVGILLILPLQVNSSTPVDLIKAYAFLISSICNRLCVNNVVLFYYFQFNLSRSESLTFLALGIILSILLLPGYCFSRTLTSSKYLSFERTCYLWIKRLQVFSFASLSESQHFTLIMLNFVISFTRKMGYLLCM